MVYQFQADKLSTGIFMKIKKKLTYPNPFGKHLRELRQARGVTQTELGKLCGLSQRMIGYYETHAKFPPANCIEPMAKALKVSADELLGIKNFKDEELAKVRNLMRRFKTVSEFPLRDQRMVFSLINTIKATHPSKTQSKNGTN